MAKHIKRRKCVCFVHTREKKESTHKCICRTFYSSRGEAFVASSYNSVLFKANRIMTARHNTKSAGNSKSNDNSVATALTAATVIKLEKSLICQWVYASFFAVVSHTYLLFVCIYYFRSISVKWLLLFVYLFFAFLLLFLTRIPLSVCTPFFLLILTKRVFLSL